MSSGPTLKPKTYQFDLDDVFDRIYPVGVYYIQFPDAASNDEATAFPASQEPESLFPGTTWEEVFGDEAVFFRTRGDPYGEETARTDGLQLDQSQKHRHTVVAKIFAYTGSGYGKAGEYGASSQTRYSTQQLEYDIYGVPRTGYENRPRNRHIKVWKRTV